MATVMALVLALSGLGSVAGQGPSEGGTGGAGGVPMLGDFSYPYFGRAEDPVVHGVVHGVRRVDGGTMLYYSLGEPTEGVGAGKTPVYSRDEWDPEHYGPRTVASVSVVDPDGLQAYRPFSADGEAVAVEAREIDAAPGRLVVAWAMLPEMPEGVTSVDVMMPRGSVVSDVPVEDGALEPVVDEPAPLLGEGWPTVPVPSDLAEVDPGVSILDLTRHVGDADGTVEVEESVEDVVVTLDADVLFDKSSFELSRSAVQEMDRVAADIAERGTGDVVITGHTDSDGSTSDNQVLSEQRARAVRDALQPASGDGVTFRVVGRGEDDPVATNATDEGQQENRRVTVEFTVEQEER
ncbi:OmpA family protein [Isoptericola chiayiensis]|nr:OmpA family protein [Isoptericola chiayiensis]NOW02091.1 outer membrane protein OmpA-like peptidoglycan-associated protein [Isoptericola chiayiensis]